MGKEQAIECFVRKLLNQASPDDLNLLENWHATHPEYREQFRLLEKFWNNADRMDYAYVERSFSKLISKIETIEGPVPAISAVVAPAVSRRPFVLRLVGIAAAILTFVLLSWLALNTTQWNNAEPVTTEQTGWIVRHNNRGIRSIINLPDGTKVWLNADSQLEFPPEFSGSLREVALNGEAFFDVVHKPEKPFVIKLNQGSIRVLGTSFNVRAYDGEEKIETSVSTGKVAFIPRYEGVRRQDTFYITPENKIAYNTKSEEANLQATQSSKDRSWIEGELNFYNATLPEFALSMERNFGRSIYFAVEDLDRIRISGSFKDDSLEDILFYVSRLTGLQYKIENEKIVLYE